MPVLTESMLRKIKDRPDLLDNMKLKYSLSYWSEHIRGFDNPPHIQEWSKHIDKVIHGGIKRLCVIAPRDHAKSEVFAINTIVYLANYGPYLRRPIKWVYLFSDTQEQANEIIERAAQGIATCYPELTQGMIKNDVRDKRLRNGFRFIGKGAGASVRGAHPDLIIGDDVLNDSNCETNLSREKLKKWWFGTVTNMCKPTSAMILEGTVQHELDLLMRMKINPAYKTFVYPAEKDIPQHLIDKWEAEHPGQPVPSWTVFDKSLVPRSL